MKLITQPADGIQPIIIAVQKATTSIKIAIFRCDLKALEKELAPAVTRGVVVHAPHTNAGGAKGLRALELRLLEGGVTVARTDDDLVRYHKNFYSSTAGPCTCSASTSRRSTSRVEASASRRRIRRSCSPREVSPQDEGVSRYLR